MPKGFYPRLSMAAPRQSTTIHTPRCGSCGLFRGCRSPKMPVAGQGRRGILVVGEAPGQTEDEQGKPFVGKTGRHLQDVLAKAGVDLFRDCWVTNSARCRPPGNVLPDKAVDHCRPYLLRAIEEHKPTTILLLGEHAMRSCLEPLGRDDVSGDGVVKKWAGWRIPCQQWNCWVCPTYHPSHVLRSLDEKRGTGQVIADDFARSVSQAVKPESRPWKNTPDWLSTVWLIHNPEEAAFCINAIGGDGGPIAFDYETNMLKPDHRDARIVCCSVSDGVNTYAFPWVGEAKKTMCKLLADPNIPKYGWNAKFETRWTLARTGIWVRGWAWDGMTAAHALDPRPGVTGLKFQAFARLGVPNYSSHVEEYLKAQGGNGRNRIREADQDAILKYCAMDSLLEYKLCRMQMKEFGVG